MSTELKHRNYLSRIASKMDKPQWYRRPAMIFCHAVFAGGGIRKLQSCRCMIVQLSEGDACLRIGRATIPDEFYMVLGENEIVLACTVHERSGDMVEVRFTSQLDGKLVNQLARLATPFATLGPILKEGGCLATASGRTENTQREAPDTNG